MASTAHRFAGPRSPAKGYAAGGGGAGAGAAAAPLPAPPPFHFRKRRDRVNWRVLASVDVVRVQRDADTATLQDVIDNIAFCDLDSEDLRYTDSNFVKLFQLAQLIIEYLLHCQSILEQSEADLARQLDEQALEITAMTEQQERDLTEIYALKKENKTLKKTIFAYQVMTKVPGYHPGAGTGQGAPAVVQYLRCRYCPKIFNMKSNLETHLRRRHADLPFYTIEEASHAVQTEPPAPTPAPAPSALPPPPPPPEEPAPPNPQQELIERLTRTIDDFGVRLQETEAAIRTELESRLAHDLADRERALAQQQAAERAAHEQEMQQLRTHLHDELDEERQFLAEERQELEALKRELIDRQREMAAMRSASNLAPRSGLGQQLEDVGDDEDGESMHEAAGSPSPEVTVDEIHHPQPSPPPHQPDLTSLMAKMEEKQELALKSIQSMVTSEINAFRELLQHDPNKQTAAELQTTAQRLEQLQQSLLESSRNALSRKQSSSIPQLTVITQPKPAIVAAPPVEVQQQQQAPAPRSVPTMAPVPEVKKQRSLEALNTQVMTPQTPKKAARHRPPVYEEPEDPEPATNDDRYNDDPSVNDDDFIECDWPIISRHLRSHKQISLPYAPWIKSAVQHAPAQVIKERESIKGELRRAMAARGVTAEAVSTPEGLDAVITEFEAAKERALRADPSYGYMYDQVWDDIEHLVANQFRFKRRPALPLRTPSRFATGTNGNGGGQGGSGGRLAPNSNWRRLTNSASPARTVLKSVLRSPNKASARSPASPGTGFASSLRRVEWRDDASSVGSDSDSDSDDGDRFGVRAVAGKVGSMFNNGSGRRGTTHRNDPASPSSSLNAGGSSWRTVRNTHAATSALRATAYSNAASPRSPSSASSSRRNVSPTSASARTPIRSSPLKKSFTASSSSSRRYNDEETEDDDADRSAGDDPSSSTSEVRPSPTTAAFRSNTYRPSMSARGGGGGGGGGKAAGGGKNTFADAAQAAVMAKKAAAQQQPPPPKQQQSQSQSLETDEEPSDWDASESLPPAQQPPAPRKAGSSGNLIRDKPGLNHVEVSSAEGESDSSYVAAPSSNPRPVPRNASGGNGSRETVHDAAGDSSGIGDLLDELASDGEGAQDRRGGGNGKSRPPPIITRVIESKPANNFSEWDVESV
ncbi:hypothetical protein H9P43_005065 [Blastocladiella emersonii ATCC 22665]|nr:hypothetical protein H9P43_005065 [Blastocladiella emersonii ATCC 22665]